MGDSGNYDANVSIKFSLKKKEKNTEQECLDFLSTHNIKYSKNINFDEDLDELIEAIKEGYDTSELLLEYRDWEEWNSTEVTLEDMLEAVEEYNETRLYVLTSKRKAHSGDLLYADLNLLKEYKITEIDYNYFYSICILSVSDSIYCDNDNSSYDSCSATNYAKIMQLPSAEIVLMGDGNANC